MFIATEFDDAVLYALELCAICTAIGVAVGTALAVFDDWRARRAK
jgi:hypothetical protein